jgi:hypothetical protein
MNHLDKENVGQDLLCFYLKVLFVSILFPFYATIKFLLVTKLKVNFKEQKARRQIRRGLVFCKISCRQGLHRENHQVRGSFDYTPT